MATRDARRILEALWAEDGDRKDPDDDTLTVQVSRRVGYPQSFSDDAGNQPPRATINQRFREWQGAASSAMRLSVPPYDATVDYPKDARASLGRDMYHALAANGPGTSVVRPDTGGNTTWVRVPGRSVNPSAPGAPTATAGNSLIAWAWNCPRDGGRRVIGFDFQWRRTGAASWSGIITTVHPFVTVEGLSNGVSYEARVRARTLFGIGPWSSEGSGAPAAVLPGQVFGAVAISGDNEFVTVRWEAADDGGSPISGYDVQWLSGNQAYSTGRQQVSAALSAVIRGLTNGTQYTFRVHATNSVGDGPWSDETTGTPADPPPPPPVIPDDAVPLQVPSAPTGSALGNGILWQWFPPRDGSRRITNFDVQIRESGDNWPGSSESSTSSCHVQASATSGTTYQIRVRAVNAIGVGQWSATGQVEA